MNARCTCEPVQVERRSGRVDTVPGVVAEGCPVHWARGRRDWTGNEASARIPGLTQHRRRLVYPCRTRIENARGGFEVEHVVERWETSAEVQRRLYLEALTPFTASSARTKNDVPEATRGTEP